MTIHVSDKLEFQLRARSEQLGLTVDELVARELGQFVASTTDKPVRRLHGKGMLHGTEKAGILARDIKKHLRGETVA